MLMFHFLFQIVYKIIFIRFKIWLIKSESKLNPNIIEKSCQLGGYSDKTFAIGETKYAPIVNTRQMTVAYQTYLFLNTSDLKNDLELSVVIFNTCQSWQRISVINKMLLHSSGFHASDVCMV